MELMERLERRMGSQHLLVDDWDTLGWEFSALPQSHTRICSLTNYTECKAEGGTLIFSIEKEYTDKHRGTYVVRIVHEEGSGPHGIAWYDGLIHDDTEITEAEIDALADELMKQCEAEGNSYYWNPWRDGKPQRNLLFRDKAFGDTVEHLVEVPHNWNEDEWDEAVRRSQD